VEGIARAQLEGVGNARLGEWIETGLAVLHLRRRLSAKEQLLVGPALDIRMDRVEVRRRLAEVKRLGILPPSYTE